MVIRFVNLLPDKRLDNNQLEIYAVKLIHSVYLNNRVPIKSGLFTK